MPIVSILLPTYKNAPYLLRAVQSVVQQSFLDWELIIIDDGLTSEAKERLLDYIKNDERIFVITNHKNLGIQKSLNIGLRISKGEYIARIDDDDEWIDIDKLSKQVNFLNENPDYVLIGTGAVVVDSNGYELMKYSFPLSNLDIKNKILYKNCFIHSSVFFRKQNALDVGGYGENNEVLHLEDYDLWLKLGLKSKVLNFSDYSIKFLFHGDSISAKNKYIQLKSAFFLTKKYHKLYPNYFICLVKARFRLVMYPLFEILPDFAKKIIFTQYKKL